MTQRQRAQTRPLTSGAGAGPWLPAALLFLGMTLALIGGIVVYQAVQQGRGSAGAPNAADPARAGASGPSAGQGGPPTATPSRGAPIVVSRGGQSGEAGGPVGDATPTPAADLRPPPLFQPSAPEFIPGSSGTPTDPAAGGQTPASPPESEDPRVEAAFAQLRTDEDKVGQLFLLGWIGSTAEAARPVIRELRPGGIVFVQNVQTSAEARAINASLPRIAAEYGLLQPLLAIDHEGGNVQRIEDVANVGSNWAFGQTGPTDLQACRRGLRHAEQLRGMGFTMNLAPALDVNNNPSNPVIGRRSYGDDPQLVARLGSAYIRGLQGGGIVAVGKHFPGHGNTSVDSHLELPILPQGIDELERIELVPFRRAIESLTDVAAIMSAHIVFPAVDPSRTPATLSQPIITGLLRERLGFRGLVISDDLGAMKAITDNYTPGQAAKQAVQAGVDMLIVSAELNRQRLYRDGVLDAVRTGEISRERLDDAVRNVLRVKARFGLLDGSTPVEAGCS